MTSAKSGSNILNAFSDLVERAMAQVRNRHGPYLLTRQERLMGLSLCVRQLDFPTESRQEYDEEGREQGPGSNAGKVSQQGGFRLSSHAEPKRGARETGWSAC